MKRIRLIHFNEAEAAGRVTQLEKAGFAVEFEMWRPTHTMRRIRANPPDLFVIDLTRMPSNGRALAIAVRTTKATRSAPIVFAGGEAAKVEKIRSLLPDATYAEWDRVRAAIRACLASPPPARAMPQQADAFASTPLFRKLGIKAGTTCLIGAPEGFEESLGDLPDGAVLKHRMEPGCGLAIWFVRSRLELEKNIAFLPERLGPAPLWIAWPKQKSGAATDLNGNIVRETGLAAGIVDYKVCSIDGTWSGLLFSTKKTAKAATKRRPASA